MNCVESSRTETLLSQCIYLVSNILRYGGVDKIDMGRGITVLWGR